MANLMDMAVDFREAFIRHLEESRIPVAAVARATGVSKHQLYKLAQRKVESTDVHDAMAVSHFFGKSLEEFIGSEGTLKFQRVLALYNALSSDEKTMLEAQLEGLASRLGRDSGKQRRVALPAPRDHAR